MVAGFGRRVNDEIDEFCEAILKMVELYVRTLMLNNTWCTVVG